MAYYYKFKLTESKHPGPPDGLIKLSKIGNGDIEERVHLKIEDEIWIYIKKKGKIPDADKEKYNITKLTKDEYDAELAANRSTRQRGHKNEG